MPTCTYWFDPTLRFSYADYDTYSPVEDPVRLTFGFGFFDDCSIELYFDGVRQDSSIFSVEDRGVEQNRPGFVGGSLAITNPGPGKIIRIQRRMDPRIPSAKYAGGGPTPSESLNTAAWVQVYQLEEFWDMMWDRLGKNAEGLWDALGLEGVNASPGLTQTSWVIKQQLDDAVGGGVRVGIGPVSYVLSPTPDGIITEWDIPDSANLSDDAHVLVNAKGVIQQTSTYAINDTVTPNKIVFNSAPLAVMAPIELIWMPGVISLGILPPDIVDTINLLDGSVTLAKLAADVLANFYSAANWPANIVDTVNVASGAITLSKLDASVLLNVAYLLANAQSPTTFYDMTLVSTREIGPTYLNGPQRRQVRMQAQETGADATRNYVELQQRVPLGSWSIVDRYWGRQSTGDGGRFAVDGPIRGGYEFRIVVAQGNVNKINGKSWSETVFAV